MRSSSTIVRALNPMATGLLFSHRRKVEGDLDHRQTRGGPCEDKGRYWSYTATRNADSHEKWEEERKVSPLEPLEGA